MSVPCLRATAAEPIRPGASVGGAQPTVVTGPPSWSTAISSRGLPPSAAARWSARVLERSWAADEKLKRNRITPPICPRRARASSDAEGARPVHAHDELLADELLQLRRRRSGRPGGGERSDEATPATSIGREYLANRAGPAAS